MPEKYAFTMRLNPGMKAEYRKRHDAIWPELVALLREAGVSDYSIHLDEATNTLFGVLWRRDGHTHGRPAETSGDAALVGSYGRHHGDEAGQRAGGGAARNRVPYGMTIAAVRHVAVIDIGKTNAKVALVDLDRLAEIDTRRTPNTVLAQWALSAFRRRSPVELHPRQPRRAQSRAPHRRDLGDDTWRGRGAARCRAAIWRCRCSTTSMTGRSSWRPTMTLRVRPSPRRGRRGCRSG